MATKATTADLNTSTAKTTEVKEAPAKTTAEEVAVNKEANKKETAETETVKKETTAKKPAARRTRKTAEKKSAEAAPIPAIKPDSAPLCNVFWIIRTPMGPNGMDTINPINIPLKRYNISYMLFYRKFTVPHYPRKIDSISCHHLSLLTTTRSSSSARQKYLKLINHPNTY